MEVFRKKAFRAFAFLSLLSVSAIAQTSSVQQLFGDLHWRLIGPFRGGRAVAVSGVPGSATHFYFGSVDGGIWQTTSAGTVWKPIFDSQKIASIGSIAVSESDPSTIYAGTGESDIRSDLATGDGVYKSTDGGATWKNIGLRDSRQISRVLIDPQDPGTVYVGVLGHAYGPSDERGVYRTKDGGATWKRILDKGPSVGIADMAQAAAKPAVLFAATWNAHRPPWSTYAPLEGPGNAIYRTTDGGDNWSQLTGHGLPAGDWGRVGVAVSPDGQRVYALIDDAGQSGLYRSDDGGESWTLANSDPRLTSRSWYFNCITIDPQHPDTLYIPNVALYRTTDAGRTISIVRGAPGGDDYHQIWVDPKNADHLVLGTDQGTSISLDHGATWTTWYNQPTGQLYHVTTDHRFPYAVYGAQQDSGAMAVYSRTDHSRITPRDWFQPGGSESGYIALDPKDEDIIYITDTYGGVQRFDRRTSFSQNITPLPTDAFGTSIDKRKYRDAWTPALVFSPADKTSLYLGTQYVMKTVDGGIHWQQISGDLTGAVKGASTTGPTTVDNAMQRGYGVVYAIAPSPLDAKLIWAGSDTGLVHLTRDGGATWSDVTPKGLTPWSKIALIEASPFDTSTAYVSVDRHRLDDMKPYIYVTHDAGHSWQLAVDGIAPDSFVNCVREDTKQRGLLYAGTERGLYVSFDDGAHWQPLQLNLPTTSVRDINIHGDDVVIATHGRSFWILDDAAPLRQMAAAAAAQKSFFYATATALRVDNDAFLGTPLPPEEPTAANPPSGAIFDYLLKVPAQTITLRIYDQHHTLLRHFSSGEKPAAHPPLPIAERWFPAPQVLQTTAGEHRFIWDLATGESGASAADDDDDDGGTPRGPRVPPGVYSAVLTIDGQTFTQPLTVAMDPRVTATTAALVQQFDLGQRIYADTLNSRKALAEAQSAQQQLKALASPDLTKGVQESIGKILDGDAGLARANSELSQALQVVESGHGPAPATALDLYRQARSAASAAEGKWAALKSSELPPLNEQLRKANKKPLAISQIEQTVEYLMTR